MAVGIFFQTTEGIDNDTRIEGTFFLQARFALFVIHTPDALDIGGLNFRDAFSDLLIECISCL